MREIKFRGRRLDKEEWVYGDLLLKPNCFPVIRTYDLLHAVADYAVDAETIGQFTGLYDKKGKEIYEGDILYVTEYRNAGVGLFDYNELLELNLEDMKGEKEDYYRSVVRFEEGAFFVSDEFDTQTYLAPMFPDQRLSSKIYEVEVIGNIHDNPELLTSTPLENA